MKFYKKTLLTLFLFFIFLFLKNNVFAVTLNFSNYPELSEFNGIEPLTLQTETNSYSVVLYNASTSIRVIEPYDSKDYLTSFMYNKESSGTYNRLLGYNVLHNSLTSCIVYGSNYVDGSWTPWASYGTNGKIICTIDIPCGYAPGIAGHTFLENSNVAIYGQGLGVIGTEVISSGIPLPNNLKFTDNISIFTFNGQYYLTYSPNKDSYFYNYRGMAGGQIHCHTPVGSMSYFDYYTYNSTSNVFEFTNNVEGFSPGYVDFLYSYNDVKIYSDGVDTFYNYASEDFFNFYYKKDYIFPHIADTDEVLSNLDDINDILVFPGDITKSQLPMVFSIYDNTNQKQIYSTDLDINSSFYLYIVENPDDYWFEIDTSEFKNSLVKGNEYLFNIYAHNDVNEFNITRSIVYGGTTYIPPTDEEIQTEAINNQTQKIEEQTNAIINQTEKIEEQTEVNKGIFARIGEILSYINPLSENFFAYKLVGILVDALKSLFIPDDGFLGTYFDELFDWFCDRLGFLSYPLELILNILDKILNINFAEPIINIPEIKEPFTNQTLISSTSFNFNSLLENETLKGIHDIYLILVDAVIVFGFVNLLKRKMEEVTTL